MCGRFTLFTDMAVLEAIFGMAGGVELVPRYNIAPSQQILAVRAGAGGAREAALLQWGLVPSWTKNDAALRPMSNARSETAAQKPSFRAAMKLRRCIVPADGFYEWRQTGKPKQPFYFKLKSGRPMAFAALWERWEPPAGEPVESCAILTTGPNELMAPLHDRLPVILAPEAFSRWLDPENRDGTAFTPLFEPYPSDLLEAYPVSTQINNARTQGKALIDPVSPATPTGLPFGP